MPCLTRTCFTDMDCWKASLIDAEHCSRVLNESAVKQVDAWQATLAWLLLFFMIPLLEAQWLESHDAGPAPLIFFSSISAGAVCHCRQVCACHLHGDFIWIIGKGKNGLNTPLLTLIYFIFCLIKLHVSLNLNCFLGNLLMWSDLQFSVGTVCITLNIKASQTGQQTLHNLLFQVFFFNGMEGSSKDSRIMSVKRETLSVFFFKEHKHVFLFFQTQFTTGFFSSWRAQSLCSWRMHVLRLFPKNIQHRLVDSRWRSN